MEEKIEEILTRGVENIIPGKSELAKLLMSGKKLNIYVGIEPTATRIHIGNGVTLRKLQSFVDLGHNVTFLIGDFTALIGDTSDKESERPILTYEEIKENFKNYKKQAGKLLDYSKVNVVFNSQWLKKLNFTDVVKLCQHFSVGDFVGRTLIRSRLESGKKVGLHETLYPVMQGYDSYFLDTDIQIGGADQTFNMQAGRSLQKDLRNKESFVLVTGYLEGTDGRKMSKSWGNAIWLTDTADEMFGKVMSIKDNLIETYYLLATNLSVNEIKSLLKKYKNDPMKLKIRLAKQIVSELHSKKDAQLAYGKFEQTFQKGLPEYEREVAYSKTLIEIVASEVGSKTQAKRLLAENAVSVNEVAISNPKQKIMGGERIKIGKRTFVTVKNLG